MLHPFSDVQCSLCQYPCLLKNIAQHFRRVHLKNSKNITLVCPENTCGVNLPTFSSFFDHICDIHRLRKEDIGYVHQMFESALNIPASISVTDITNEYSTQHISKIIDETVAEFLIETNTLSLKCINGIKTMLNSIFQKTNDIAKENALKKCRIFSECLNIKTNNFVLENAPILKKRFRMRNELPELHYGNFTLDLQTYLSIERKLNKKVDLFLKENEVIHIILFFDDAIPGNGLSTTASMFSICNFAYRVYLPDISNPSHRRHFRLLACARTFYVKFDKYLKSTQFLVEMINSHEITLDSKSYTCKVRCVTVNDNEK
uniref:C2H2-type domain-containing protein n=1 Tax=Strongyloides papillosus TaxID=174720 RepID=A0A0N5CHE5_STREA